MRCFENSKDTICFDCSWCWMVLLRVWIFWWHAAWMFAAEEGRFGVARADVGLVLSGLLFFSNFNRSSSSISSFFSSRILPCLWNTNSTSSLSSSASRFQYFSYSDNAKFLSLKILDSVFKTSTSFFRASIFLSQLPWSILSSKRSPAPF